MTDFSQIPKVYRDLQKRLDQFPIGAPETPELYEILRIVFTDEEAYVASRMPLTRVPLEEAVQAVGIDREPLLEILERMAEKGVVINLEKAGRTVYGLQGTLTGFFEFAFQKPRAGWPMERLAELTHRYFYEGGHADDFMKLRTPRIRAVSLNRALKRKPSEIKPYEEIEEIVKASGGGAILKCYCRHKALLRGEPCEHPIDLCLSLGRGAEFLASRGMGRKASVEELMDKVVQAEELGLVHAVDNFQDRASLICNCCKCSCEFLGWMNHARMPGSVQPSNFLPKIDTELCIGCGACAERCPVDAVAVEGDLEPVARVDEAWCLGCGVCETACPKGAISLVRRSEVVEPPKDMRSLWQLISEAKQAAKRDRVP
ncbi:MAG: 4Fe-4S binding protein [Deltaproteobacteria bacterium]|nr:4Fe-4S binding protein [Deltaproteobacteria bacterium]